MFDQQLATFRPATVVSSLMGSLVLGLAAHATAATSIPVTVVNTPSVTVANPVTVTGTVNATGTVNVNSGKANPVFVDTDVNARNAIGASCDATFDANGHAICPLSTTYPATPLVPAGRTLVIETLTCAASVNGAGTPYTYGQLPVQLVMAAPPNGANFYHWFLLTRYLSLTNGSPQLDYYRLTSPTRMYAASVNGGSTDVYVDAQIGPSTANVGGVSCSISGYLVAQ
jgi:hypothetical protein